MIIKIIKTQDLVKLSVLFLVTLIKFMPAQNISLGVLPNRTGSDSNLSTITQNLNSLPDWLASSLAGDKIQTLLDIDIIDENKFVFIGKVIENSIINKHVVIVIYAPLLSATGRQTCIVNNDSTVTILSFDYEKGFNKMILEENIRVESFDRSKEIARLFIRTMLPLISVDDIFFMDELTYSSFEDYGNNVGRPEIKLPLNDTLISWYSNEIYNGYKKTFKKDLEKRRWFTQVNKRDSIYTVNIFTAGRIREHSCSRFYNDRVLNWQVIVYPNGTIKAKLPKGVKVYTIYD